MSSYKNTPIRSILIGVTLAAVVGCGRQTSDPAPVPKGIADGISIVQLLAPTEESDPAPLFELLSPARTGVDFVVPIDAQHPMRHMFGGSGFAMGGVAIGDFDGDGLPDLYLVSGPGKNRLYRQTAEFQFTDITKSARVDGGDA